MGSGVLLAALVVLWFVVLVPMVVTRGDAQGVGWGLPTPVGRCSGAGRWTPSSTPRPNVSRSTATLLRTSGELQVDVHALRRRTLAGLAALAALALVGALVYSPWLWTAQGLLDLAVVGYLLVLRKVARRERLAARRAARAAAREALRTPVVRPRRRSARPIQETVAQEALPSLPHPSVPLAPVHEFPTGRRVAARAPAPAGWQHSAVVGLDDDDIGFADIDEYQPRRAANA